MLTSVTSPVTLRHLSLPLAHSVSVTFNLICASFNLRKSDIGKRQNESRTTTTLIVVAEMTSNDIFFYHMLCIYCFHAFPSIFFSVTVCSLFISLFIFFIYFVLSDGYTFTPSVFPSCVPSATTSVHRPQSAWRSMCRSIVSASAPCCVMPIVTNDDSSSPTNYIIPTMSYTRTAHYTPKELKRVKTFFYCIHIFVVPPITAFPPLLSLPSSPQNLLQHPILNPATTAASSFPRPLCPSPPRKRE